MYEPPEHLVLHHDHVAEGLTGALVGVITVKDPQLSTLSIKFLYDPGSAFEVKTIITVHVIFSLLFAKKTPRSFKSERVGHSCSRP